MKDKKKLIFCTYSSIYSSIVLAKILEDENIDVVAIVNSSRIINPKYNLIKGSFKQIQLSGWRYSSYLFLITDFFSWIQLAIKYKKKSLKTIHELAKNYAIPILNTKDINDKNSLAFIRYYPASFLLAAHFNQLIKSEILSIANLQCLNIHPSLLPAFKGVDPVFYALLNEQVTLGVSLHKMAECFDTGKILSQEKLTVSLSTRCVFLINCSLFAKGSELAIKWVNNESHNSQAIENTNPSQFYDSWPSAEKTTEFVKSGKKLMCLQNYFSAIFSGIQR